MIHMMIKYGDRIETKELDETDMEDEVIMFEAIEAKMEKMGCTSIVITLDNGFQVLYTRKTD